MMLKLLLWYLRKRGWDYQIKKDNHRYIGGPGSIGIMPKGWVPTEKLHIPPGEKIGPIYNPEQKLIVNGNIRNITRMGMSTPEHKLSFENKDENFVLEASGNLITGFVPKQKLNGKFPVT